MDRRLRWLAVALSCALAGTAHAQALTGTLKKIKDTGVVSLGIRESSVPFSYSDNQQKNIGYSRDIASRIIDQLKTELNAPNLTVKEIPITSQNRIPLLQNGRSISNADRRPTRSNGRSRPHSRTASFFMASASARARIPA